MSLITQEYTVLSNKDGGEDVVIKPNVPFKPIEGNYVVTAYALIRDAKTREQVVILNPGDKIKNVGTPIKAKRTQVAKPKRKSVPKGE